MKTVEALPTATPQKISCLLLPLADSQLLAPVDALAEIIAMQSPAPVVDAPAWYLGELHWRRQRLPLLAFEVLRGQALPNRGEDCRIAILNSGNAKAGQLPFIALVLQGTPRLVHVTADALAERDAPCVLGELMHVALSGEAAVIPDLDALEQACMQKG